MKHTKMVTETMKLMKKLKVVVLHSNSKRLVQLSLRLATLCATEAARTNSRD